MSTELNEAINRLHRELAGHPALDEGSMKALKSLMSEIQQAVSEPKIEIETSHESLTLSERVERAIDDLEAHHPSLTRTLSMIAERLADMGI